MKKWDLLVQLDKEPFLVQVAMKRAALKVAARNLAGAKAQVRGLEGLALDPRAWQESLNGLHAKGRQFDIFSPII